MPIKTILVVLVALTGCGRSLSEKAGTELASVQMTKLYTLLDRVQDQPAFANAVAHAKAKALIEMSTVVFATVDNQPFKIKGETFANARDLIQADQDLQRQVRAASAGSVADYIARHHADHPSPPLICKVMTTRPTPFINRPRRPDRRWKARLTTKSFARDLNTMLALQTLGDAVKAAHRAELGLNPAIGLAVVVGLTVVEEGLVSSISEEQRHAGVLKKDITKKQGTADDESIKVNSKALRNNDKLAKRDAPPTKVCSQEFVNGAASLGWTSPVALNNAKTRTFVCEAGDDGKYEWMVAP